MKLDELPRGVKHAIEIASKTRFCQFLGEATPYGHSEFQIDACIWPHRVLLGKPRPAPYKVRFLIPSSFPFSKTHTIPLDPQLRWNPHQNGDWPSNLDLHANVICPPSDPDPSEYLLPYIRHAYDWIADALGHRLTEPTERYEFPHLMSAKNGFRVVAQGGESILNWVEAEKYGRCWSTIHKPKQKSEFLVVKEFLSLKNEDRQFDCRINPSLFGNQDSGAWLSWVFVGDPVANRPHKSFTAWKEFNPEIRRRIILALEDANRFKIRRSIILCGFRVPERWDGSGQSRLVWKAVLLNDVDGRLTKLPKSGGFHRAKKDVLLRPGAARVAAANQRLGWLATESVSIETLTARQGNQMNFMAQRSVAIVGIGAVGAAIAKSIAKLAPIRLTLIDNESLELGNMIRHEAANSSIGKYKVDAIQELLVPLTTDREVTPFPVDVVVEWDRLKESLSKHDLVIDVTGNTLVRDRLDTLRETAVSSCFIKPGPSFGVVLFRRKGSKVWLSELEARLLELVPNEFQPEYERDAQGEGMVWPEQGCYDPTFEAPYYRIQGIVASMVGNLVFSLRDPAKENLIALYHQKETSIGIEQSMVLSEVSTT